MQQCNKEEGDEARRPTRGDETRRDEKESHIQM